MVVVENVVVIFVLLLKTFVIIFVAVLENVVILMIVADVDGVKIVKNSL
jgi:hypothetical protein